MVSKGIKKLFGKKKSSKNKSINKNAEVIKPEPVQIEEDSMKSPESEDVSVASEPRDSPDTKSLDAVEESPTAEKEEETEEPKEEDEAPKEEETPKEDESVKEDEPIKEEAPKEMEEPVEEDESPKEEPAKEEEVPMEEETKEEPKEEEPAEAQVMEKKSRSGFFSRSRSSVSKEPSKDESESVPSAPPAVEEKVTPEDIEKPVEEEEEEHTTRGAFGEEDAKDPELTINRVDTFHAEITLPNDAKSGDVLDVPHDETTKTIKVPKDVKAGEPFTVKFVHSEEAPETGAFCGCL